MRLHVFNPEHDIALARDDMHFTAPKAARTLRENCGFLPALWADNGDFVLVSDKDSAVEKLRMTGVRTNKVDFTTADELCRLPSDIVVEPWGWDSALCLQLSRHGIQNSCLPGEGELQRIRELSNRNFSSRMLRLLRECIDSDSSFTVGQSYYVSDVEDVAAAVGEFERVVLKEPWSCSGRGVRYIAPVASVSSGIRFEAYAEPIVNWTKNVIRQQGGIMIEPYYNNVLDFGMEFYSLKEGIRYCGLSVFSTVSGFYNGNVVASEERKQQMLSPLLASEKLVNVKEAIVEMLSREMKDRYLGPFGVDMMMVRTGDGSLRLHPMVEINIRRTMGHVALSLFGKLSYAEAVVNLSGGTCTINPIART